MSKDDKKSEPFAWIAKNSWIIIGIIILFLIAVVFAVVYYLVSRAESGEAGPLDTFLLSVIGLITTVLASILVAKPMAKRDLIRANEPFLRAAFRSQYHLHRGLERIISRCDGISTNERAQLDLPIIRELIFEHIQRAQEGMHNWRELLPGELDYLDQMKEKKADDTAKLDEAIREFAGLARYGEEFRDLVAKLKSERDSLSNASLYSLGQPMTEEPRKLLLRGAYNEAVAAYSQLIDRHPNNYTLYVARGKARDKAGDKAGALQDYDAAVKLQPNNASIARERDALRKGESLAPSSFSSPEHLRLSGIAENKLAMADGDGAMEFYRRAAEAGLLPVYVHQNYAMVHLVKNDAPSARRELGMIDEGLLGRYLRVQHCALLALCSILEEEDHAAQMAELDAALAACPDFKTSQSPLRSLALGLRRKIPDNADVKALFNTIRGDSKGLQSVTDTPTFTRHMHDGNVFISSGRGEEAMEAYRRAEEAGLIRLLACQGYAMAHLVKGEPPDARKILHEVSANVTGLYVRVQHCALLALCSILEEEDHTAQMAELDAALAACPDFMLINSPLRFLQAGLLLKMPQPSKDVADVFRALAKQG